MHEVDNPLNADLTSVDTSFPVLEAGVISCVIAEMKEGETKENKKPVLNIKLTTAQPWKTTRGDEKPAGFPLNDMVSLSKTDKYDPRQRLAQIKEAVFGDKAGAFGQPAEYIGKPVTVRIKVENDEEYGPRNRVASYVKLVR